MLQYVPTNIREMRLIIVREDLQQTESRFETTKTRAEIGKQKKGDSKYICINGGPYSKFRHMVHSLSAFNAFESLLA